jgi:hypothetical protein
VWRAPAQFSNASSAERRRSASACLLCRHPPLELDPTAALQAQQVSIGGERIHVGVPGADAVAVREDETAKFGVDSGHQRGGSTSGMLRVK